MLLTWVYWKVFDPGRTIQQPTPIMTKVMLLSYQGGLVHNRYMSGSGMLFTTVAHHLLYGFH
jgi:hypothetical protein